MKNPACSGARLDRTSRMLKKTTSSEKAEVKAKVQSGSRPRSTSALTSTSSYLRTCGRVLENSAARLTVKKSGTRARPRAER